MCPRPPPPFPRPPLPTNDVGKPLPANGGAGIDTPTKVGAPGSIIIGIGPPIIIPGGGGIGGPPNMGGGRGCMVSPTHSRSNPAPPHFGVVGRQKSHNESYRVTIGNRELESVTRLLSGTSWLRKTPVATLVGDLRGCERPSPRLDAE